MFTYSTCNFDSISLQASCFSIKYSTIHLIQSSLLNAAKVLGFLDLVDDWLPVRDTGRIISLGPISLAMFAHVHVRQHSDAPEEGIVPSIIQERAG